MFYSAGWFPPPSSTKQPHTPTPPPPWPSVPCGMRQPCASCLPCFTRGRVHVSASTSVRPALTPRRPQHLEGRTSATISRCCGVPRPQGPFLYPGCPSYLPAPQSCAPRISSASCLPPLPYHPLTPRHSEASSCWSHSAKAALFQDCAAGIPLEAQWFKTLRFHRRGRVFHPWSGNYDPACHCDPACDCGPARHELGRDSSRDKDCAVEPGTSLRQLHVRISATPAWKAAATFLSSSFISTWNQWPSPAVSTSVRGSLQVDFLFFFFFLILPVSPHE